jgi:hypothetical protein
MTFDIWGPRHRRVYLDLELKGPKDRSLRYRLTPLVEREVFRYVRLAHIGLSKIEN